MSQSGMACGDSAARTIVLAYSDLVRCARDTGQCAQPGGSGSPHDRGPRDR